MRLGRKKIAEIKKRGVRLKGGYTLVKLTALGKKRMKNKSKARKKR